MVVASHNDIPYNTAWRWVSQPEKPNVWTPRTKPRRGSRHMKILPEHITYLVSLLEYKCQLTLIDMVDELKTVYNVDVSPQAVRRTLEAICFTLKKIHAEPSDMNSDRVKPLREKYVPKLGLPQEA